MFLALLSKEDLVLINHEIIKPKIVSWMSWIVARKVSISKCILCKAVTPALYIPFFTRTGNKIKTLLVTARGEDEIEFGNMLCFAAAVCTNIEELTLKKCSSIHGLLNVLYASHSSIIDLTIDNCNVNGLEVVDLTLPFLKRWCINDCTNIASSTLKELLQAAPNLEIFVADKVNGWPTGAMGSQYLRVLSIDTSDINDPVFCSLVHSCPLLEVVQLRSCYELTDASVLELVQHAKHLSALYLCNNLVLTDTALEAIAVHCGERLRHLSIFDCIRITDAGLYSISEACHSLQGLGIGGFVMEHITTAAVKALLHSNPLLQEVSFFWSKRVQDADALLMQLAASCIQVRHLDIYEFKGYTERGIAAISRSCTQLHTVIVDPDCTVINPLCRYFWQEHCSPGLEFLLEETLLPFWADSFSRMASGSTAV